MKDEHTIRGALNNLCHFETFIKLFTKVRLNFLVNFEVDLGLEVRWAQLAGFLVIRDAALVGESNLEWYLGLAVNLDLACLMILERICSGCRIACHVECHCFLIAVIGEVLGTF